MVAYSFQSRFVPLILAGEKTQTIRRVSRKRVRKGDVLQLYTGLRTPGARVLRTAVCDRVSLVDLWFGESTGYMGGHTCGLDEFAQRDGFACWADLRIWFEETYPGVQNFTGVLIVWRDFTAADGEREG